MGLLSKLFPKRQPQQTTPPPPKGYVTFTETQPTFASWDGSLYDHPLTRAAIERFASACSKLKPECVASTTVDRRVSRLFETSPNDLYTWPTFLARAATVYEMDTSVWIVPGLDRDLNTVGLYVMKPSYVEIAEYAGEPWCVFHLMNGETMAIEYARCALISKFQYLSDFFGSGNGALDPTMRLMDAQRQAEEQAVKNGARIRFIGRISGMTHGDDLNRKREKFYADNLSPRNTTGLMLYDSTFDNVEQVKEDRFIIDDAEMKRVSSAVFYYLGMNEHILTNDYTEEQWGAWYEGKVEPFALALSEALSKMLFTVPQRLKGCKVMFSSSYMQYASPASKRNMIRDMVGMSEMTINEGREVLQLPPIPGGDVRIMRGEYYILDEYNNILAESGGRSSEERSAETDAQPETAKTDMADAGGEGE